ncbi:MAG: tRNA pseudouridine(13) synthase TruD, partial [Legionella sp.]
PGKRKNMVQGDAADLIQPIYDQWLPWIQGLEKNGLEEAWRATILHPEQLSYRLQDEDVELSFNLPAGAYATAVLRELVNY